jgi:hypothetical protein
MTVSGTIPWPIGDVPRRLSGLSLTVSYYDYLSARAETV